MDNAKSNSKPQGGSDSQVTYQTYGEIRKRIGTLHPATFDFSLDVTKAMSAQQSPPTPAAQPATTPSTSTGSQPSGSNWPSEDDDWTGLFIENQWSGLKAKIIRDLGLDVIVEYSSSTAIWSKQGLTRSYYMVVGAANISAPKITAATVLDGLHQKHAEMQAAIEEHLQKYKKAAPCNHDWKDYIGLTHRDHYCSKCNAKKEWGT